MEFIGSVGQDSLNVISVDDISVYDNSCGSSPLFCEFKQGTTCLWEEIELYPDENILHWYVADRDPGHVINGPGHGPIGDPNNGKKLKIAFL